MAKYFANYATAKISDQKAQYTYYWDSKFLKTVAFIAGKKNPAVQKKIISFSIEIKL